MIQTHRLSCVNRLAVLGLLVGGIFLVSAIPAQDQTAQQSGGVSNSLTEIVITAMKRRSTVQTTPESVTALSGDTLQAWGITNLATVAEQVPGMSVKSTGVGQNELLIRGISSLGGESPAIGFYLNDTPVTAPAFQLAGKVVLDTDLYDLNRIEVLRGPQGTLYGSGSMGGTVKLVTNLPDTRQFAANADATLSGTDGGGFNYGVNAMLNLPLVTDKVGLRIVATRRDMSGWIDRVVVSPFPLSVNNERGNVEAAPIVADYPDVNWHELDSARVTLLFQPTDAVTITPLVMYQRLTAGGYDQIDVPPGTDAHYQPFDIAEPLMDMVHLASLTIRANLGFGSLTAVSSYFNKNTSQTQDNSETAQISFGLPGLTVASGGIGAVPVTETSYTREFSQEIRLASNDSGAFQWLVGGFYSNYDFQDGLFSTNSAIETVFDEPNSDLITDLIPVKLKQYAVFADATYDITRQLQASVGLRHFSYNTTSDMIVSGLYAETPGGTDTFGGSTSSSGVVPKFTLSYMPSNDLTVYSTASKGFRPGGYSPVPIAGPGGCGSDIEALGRNPNGGFSPDTVWSYEVGEKSILADSRLSIHSDVYDEEWKDLQQFVPLTCGWLYTANAGNARLYGGELEVAARILPPLRLNLSAGYVHAAYTDTTSAATEGQTLPNTPKFTGSAALVYDTAINENYSFEARASNDYVSSRMTVVAYAYELPSYDIVNLRLGVISEKLSAYVFVDNLTNRQALLGAGYGELTNVAYLPRFTVNRPLTGGVDVAYRF